MQPGEMSDRMAQTAEAAASDQADRAAYVRYAAEDLARSGNEGAVLNWVHAHEHARGTGSELNPWRLIEHLALAQMRRRATPNPQQAERSA